MCERVGGGRDHPDTFGLRNLNADSAYIPFAKHAAFFELAAEVASDGCHGLHLDIRTISVHEIVATPVIPFADPVEIYLTLRESKSRAQGSRRLEHDDLRCDHPPPPLSRMPRSMKCYAAGPGPRLVTLAAQDPGTAPRRCGAHGKAIRAERIPL